MLRVITWNVNGLRAALRKGFASAIDELKPDVVLLQEIRSTPEQLGEFIDADGRFLKTTGDGWHCHWHPAEKLGYAGTAVLSRLPFLSTDRGLGKTDKDDEGRVATAVLDHPSKLRVTSVYLPSGSSGDHRQEAKEAWMPRFRRWAGKTLKESPKTPTIVAGDFNNALTPADIYYAKGNEKTSGYLPHERAWMAGLVRSGWHDLIREAYPDGHHAESGKINTSAGRPAGGPLGPFTWWSNRGQAMALDRGWRIDYVLANDAAASCVREVRVHRGIVSPSKLSDHAPVSVDLNL